MPYIGRELDSGNYLKLDDISSSFNGSTTTFNLTAAGKAFFPGSAFSILVNLAGVAQEPESAYQINNATITFATAPVAGDQFFCIVLGVAHGVNVPGNGTVNGAQLAKPFNYDGYFYLDDANNRVGVGTLTPAKPLHVVGEGQFDSVRVLGDLTVDGTTTTLDTVVTEVDRLEVGANNNTVGLAVTQSGSGGAAIFMGGSVGINSATPRALVDFGPGTGNGTLNQTVGNYQAVFEAPQGTGNFSRNIAFAAVNTGISAAINAVDEGGSSQTGLIFATGTAGAITERLRITAAGQVAIATATNYANANADDLIVGNRSNNESGVTIGSSNQGQIAFADSGDNRAGLIHYQHTDNSMRFYTNGATNERLRITSVGSVGIGTNSPQSQFEVFGSSPIIRSKHNTSQKYTQINHNGTDGYVDWSSGNLILRGASNVERLRIDSNGYVDIQTGILGDNPSDNFTLNGRTQPHYGFNLVPETGVPIGIAGYRGIAFASSGTERMRISEGGLVGIGVTNPGSALHVEVGSGEAIRASASGANQHVWARFIAGSPSNTDLRIGADSASGGVYGVAGGAVVWNAGNGPLAFGTNNAERLRINSAGSVGIGTISSPSKVTIGAVSSPSFNRGAVAIKAMDTDAACGTSGIYIEESSTDSGQGEGYYITVDAAGDLNFHNSGAATPTVTFNDAGKVGINEDNPGAKLHVVDTMQATANGHSQILILGDDSGTDGESASIYMSAINASNRGCKILSERQSSSNNHDLIFQVSGVSAIPTERLRIASDGVITINTVPATNNNANQAVLFQTAAGAIHGGSGLLYNPAEDTLKVNGNIINSNAFYGAGSGPLVLAVANYSSTQYIKVSNKIEIKGNVGINEATPAVSLDLSSNTDAVSLPTGTTAQRPSGTDAYIRKNSTNNALEFYNGTNWVEIITDYFPTGSVILG